MEIKNLFNLGDDVYVKTDPEQHKGIVISITKNWNGGIIYEVAFGTEAHNFQAIELSTQRDLQITVQLDQDND